MKLHYCKLEKYIIIHIIRKHLKTGQISENYLSYKERNKFYGLA